MCACARECVRGRRNREPSLGLRDLNSERPEPHTLGDDREAGARARAHERRQPLNVSCHAPRLAPRHGVGAALGVGGAQVVAAGRCPWGRRSPCCCGSPWSRRGPQVGAGHGVVASLCCHNPWGRRGPWNRWGTWGRHIQCMRQGATVAADGAFAAHRVSGAHSVAYAGVHGPSRPIGMPQPMRCTGLIAATCKPWPPHARCNGSPWGCRRPWSRAIYSFSRPGVCAIALFRGFRRGGDLRRDL